jgi:nucleotide-binding universal stress UspA family protein
MRILIGIENSEPSKRALAFVRGIPWPAGAATTIATVIRTDVFALGDMYAPVAAEMEILRREEEKRAHAFLDGIQRELDSAGIKAETRVLNGDPRFALVDAARDSKADLLVVGSHGRTGVKKLLLGSVASHVVTHAPCSVLVVKERP